MALVERGTAKLQASVLLNLSSFHPFSSSVWTRKREAQKSTAMITIFGWWRARLACATRSCVASGPAISSWPTSYSTCACDWMSTQRLRAMMTAWRGPRNFPRGRCVYGFSGVPAGWSSINEPSSRILQPFSHMAWCFPLGPKCCASVFSSSPLVVPQRQVYFFKFLAC